MWMKSMGYVPSPAGFSMAACRTVAQSAHASGSNTISQSGTSGM